MKNISNIFTPALLFLTLLSSCGGTDEKNKTADAASGSDTTAVLTTNNRIAGVARIEPQEGLLNLTAGAAGKVVQVLVRENEQVRAGQPLLQLEVAVEQAQLAQAESKIATQRSAIEAARANLGALNVQLDNARSIAQRNRQMFEAKAQTQEALENSQAEADRLEKEVANANAGIAQSNARLKELEADINYYRTVLRDKHVTAPVSGKLLDVMVQPGDYLGNETVVAEMAPTGALIAKTEVDEIFAQKVKVGQKAEVRSQTTGEKMAEGEVVFAADYLKAKSLFKDQSTEQEDRRVREVHIKLESGEMPLIGSRVDCIIYID